MCLPGARPRRFHPPSLDLNGEMGLGEGRCGADSEECSLQGPSPSFPFLYLYPANGPQVLMCGYMEMGPVMVVVVAAVVFGRKRLQMGCGCNGHAVNATLASHEGHLIKTDSQRCRQSVSASDGQRWGP